MLRGSVSELLAASPAAEFLTVFLTVVSKPEGTAEKLPPDLIAGPDGGFLVGTAKAVERHR
jgi:hypothetical protein